MYARRDFESEHKKNTRDRRLNYEKDPISHLVKQDGFRGIVVNNLTPEPVFIKDKIQYERLLKSTHSQEIKR